MLTWLSVRDLAIVDHVTVEPAPGLNVVTGETGAGKSILIAALQLALGARGRADLVRTGAEEAVIEATFDLRHAPGLRARVAALTDEDDVDELIVRRTLKPNGRSRAWIHGVMVPATRLAEVLGGVVDICSQHEHHGLADPTSHLAYLDAFADLDAPGQAMLIAWRAYREAADTLDALAEQVRRRSEREAILRFQLEELDAADPQAGEHDALEAEIARLGHADRLARATAEADDVLHSGESAVAGRIARLARTLGDVRGVDASLDTLLDRLDELLTLTEELGRDLGRYGRRIVHDPDRLREAEARLGTLRSLARRHGGSVDDLVALRARLRSEKAGLDALEDKMEACEAARQRALDAAARQARALSEARREAAAALGGAITAELADLGMGNARVQVDVARREQRGDGPDVDGARLGPQGLDRVELLIAPNKGEPPRPLHRIASGGELSRSLLAIKRVLAARSPRGLYVFDEVDTGVGGAIAESIGRKLADVARHQQVLCITHQPQIAVYGDAHWHVSKDDAADHTRSAVTRLDDDARLREVARMLGGIEVTDAHRAAAADLLAAARRART